MVKALPLLLGAGWVMWMMTGCSLTMPPPQPVDSPARPPHPAAEPAARAPLPRAVYVQVSSLNLRQCPSRDCRIVTVLHQRQKLDLLAEQAGWAQVELGDGRKGWVAARYLGPTPAGVQPPNKPVGGGPDEAPALQEEFAAPTAPPPLQEEFAR